MDDRRVEHLINASADEMWKLQSINFKDHHTVTLDFIGSKGTEFSIAGELSKEMIIQQPILKTILTEKNIKVENLAPKPF